ncbi:neurogenic protein big brain-like [Amphibalanus amphitrite]|uniref:neurogenic protein big brain-like n=1 Tax=Amphibalanus amphitrite TaxID=1232801 RepID=UPI001C920168|nr:neurogenic protein big brain-like [Amphibalanus amphitrite]
MTITSLSAETLDSHILTLIDKLDHVQGELSPPPARLPMHVEVRRLEFWRAIIAECMATFFFVFLICAANVPWSTHTVWAAQSLFAGAFTAGLAAAALTQCFWRVSGAHMNPAVTLAHAATRKVSPLRCLLYITAQCGGAIAGAALLYGSSTTSLQGSLGVTVVTPPLTAWQGFGVEFVLTFILVFVVFSVSEPSRRPLGNSAVVIGFTYLAVSLAGIRCTGASVNPARSLGPAFVMNIWKDHWVYWFSPLTAAVVASYVHEYIFNPNRRYRLKDTMDTESLGGQSDDEVFEEDRPKLSSADYNTLRSQSYAIYGAGSKPSPAGGARSVFSVPAYRGVHRAESVYGGTKSLYACSPPPSRAHLARSQSVYTKDRRCAQEGGRAGITAAQSVYPRIGGGGGLAQTESMYATRSCARQEPTYADRRAAAAEQAEAHKPLYSTKEDALSYSTATTQFTASSRADDYGHYPAVSRHDDYAVYGKQPELYSKPQYPSYQSAAAENAHNQRSAAGRSHGSAPGAGGLPSYGAYSGRSGPPPPPPPPRNGDMMSPRSVAGSETTSGLTTPNSVSSYR